MPLRREELTSFSLSDDTNPPDHGENWLAISLLEWKIHREYSFIFYLNHPDNCHYSVGLLSNDKHQPVTKFDIIFICQHHYFSGILEKRSDKYKCCAWQKILFISLVGNFHSKESKTNLVKVTTDAQHLRTGLKIRWSTSNPPSCFNHKTVYHPNWLQFAC